MRLLLLKVAPRLIALTQNNIHFYDQESHEQWIDNLCTNKGIYPEPLFHGDRPSQKSTQDICPMSPIRGHI
jgi:hypothetical protein